MRGIYLVTEPSGDKHYVGSRVEADHLWNERGGRLEFIAIPQTAREFLSFMIRHEDAVRPLRQAARNCDALHAGGAAS